jgi:hypothetical protein
MLLKLVSTLPEGKHWHYEVKWDGYRGIAVLQDGKARLWSRNERDLGRRFPVLVEALGKLPARSAALDGEIVVLDEAGKPDFEALQYFQPASAAHLYFYAFDLLHLRHWSLYPERQWRAFGGTQASFRHFGPRGSACRAAPLRHFCLASLRACLKMGKRTSSDHLVSVLRWFDEHSPLGGHSPNRLDSHQKFLPMSTSAVSDSLTSTVRLAPLLRRSALSKIRLAPSTDKR